MIIHETIHLDYLDQDRTLRIYLPPNYEDANEYYPVLYMHDAQNLFEPETSTYGDIWDVHTHLNNMYQTTQKGFIVVGLDNNEGGHNRLDEYSPWINKTLKEDDLFSDIHEDVGGLGEAYVDFIVNVLKARIDKCYRTLEDTAIIGSSMGGLISLYAGVKYPHVFKRIGAFSTAVWFAEKALLAYMNKGVDPNTLWYLDIGTHETSHNDQSPFNQLYLSGTKKVYQTLLNQTSERQVKLVIDEGGIHNEKDWSKRFTSAIQFLYNDYLISPMD